MKSEPIPALSPDDVARFWSRVAVAKHKATCWEWRGATLSENPLQRYGRFRVKGRQHLAHRVAFLIYYGALTPSLCVCHRCDNPLCCNPHHLWEGTYEDNVRDCESKGRARHPMDAEHPHTRLSLESMRAIRDRARAGEIATHLAREFGISRNYVYAIKNGRGRGRIAKLLAEAA